MCKKLCFLDSPDIKEDCVIGDRCVVVPIVAVAVVTVSATQKVMLNYIFIGALKTKTLLKKE